MKIVSIIGPIGSGKSTFVKQLTPYNQFDAYYHEDVKGNKYLKMPPTIENQVKCQEYIINHKKSFYQQFSDQELTNLTILEDASLYQDLFYVYLNLYEQDREAFDLIYNEYLELIKNIYLQADEHEIIFIDLDSKQNLKNVKKRGRDFEQSLDQQFFSNQRNILLSILDYFKDNFKLTVYQPQPEMFKLHGKALANRYHQIFKDLELI